MIVSLKANERTAQLAFGDGRRDFCFAGGRSARCLCRHRKQESESGTRRATGALRALGREGGVTQWMRTLAMPLRGALTLGNGKLFAGGSDGKVYAFDSSNGEALWSFDYGAPFNSQPVVSGSRVYIGSEDGNLLALDEDTGKLLWRYRTKGRGAGAGRKRKRNCLLRFRRRLRLRGECYHWPITLAQADRRGRAGGGSRQMMSCWSLRWIILFTSFR